MELFTEQIEEKLQKQYRYGSSLIQNVVVKIYHPHSSWVWYIMNQDPKDPDYLWAIVKGFAIELRSTSKSELEKTLVPPFYLPLERDLDFIPLNAEVVWNRLVLDEYV